MRAMRVDYNAYEQVRARIKAFEAMNHKTDKIELIVMGGTFLEYPKRFQYEFIKECYDGLNKKKSKTLEESQTLNENAKHRCVALCIETRPDVCSEYIERMNEFGVTRVELGVQIIDDNIYKRIKRGHTVKDVVVATEKLKNAGFKIGYHIMPGLPGSNLKKDLEFFKKLFSDQRFKPDQLKIYPCQVMPGSELESLYWEGKYKPYTREQTEKLLIQMLRIVPRYCRVMRIMREIPPEYLIAGTVRIDLRKDIEEGLRKKNIKLKEIRYREVGFALRDNRKINTNLKLKITKYHASNGKEYFLEVINEDNILFGLLRCRIFDKSPQIARANALEKDDELINKPKKSIDLTASKKFRASGNERANKQAIIRELHIYGQSLKLGDKNNLAVQHKGIGIFLMNEAEEVSKNEKVKKLGVISGVGAREYYRKLGYELKKGYMVKEFG